MKQFISTAALLCTTATCLAQFGVFQPSESFTYIDEGSGRNVVCLTDTTKNDKFLYQTDPMFTADGKYIIFRSSSRTDMRIEVPTQDGKGTRQITPTLYYFIELSSGKIIQATNDAKIANVYLGNKSNKLFYNKREEDNSWKLYVMDLDKYFADAKKGKAKSAAKYETLLGTYPANTDSPGNFCVSCDDQWAYITVQRKGTPEEIEAMNAKAFKPLDNQPIKVQPTLSGIRKMNLTTGEVTKVVDLDFRVGHIQSSRFRPGEIVFCNETGGDANQRMWFCTADGSILKPLYVETSLDWVTHETFASEDFVYFNVLGFQDRLRKQASGIFRINLRNDDIEVMGQVELDKDVKTQLVGRGFWHCNATRDNKWATGDTFGGSVWIIDVETGHRYKMASDAKMTPDHAQPFFSPDGKTLFYQSGHFASGKRLNLMKIDIDANIK